MRSIERQAKLIWDTRAKIPHSLGNLEEVAVRCCTILNTLNPSIDNPTLVLAASDHGVTSSYVSASKTEVTSQMMKLFARGNGTCAVLCHEHGVRLNLVDVGMKIDLPADVVPSECSSWISYENCKIRYSSNDFSKTKALTKDDVEHALDAGRKKAESLFESGCNTVLLGEMGIGNTTSAGAIASALTGLCAEDCLPCGSARGPMMGNKIAIVSKAVDAIEDKSSLIDVLCSVGGLELIYLAGVVDQASKRGMIVLNDGFLTTVSVLVASKIRKQSLQNVICCHDTGEKAHSNLLRYLGLKPLLEMNMHLGEGSGALAAIPVIRESLYLFNNLSSFHESGVTGRPAERRLAMAVGTSSYIIPADILPNVEYLKDKVQDIELVLFESKEASNLPTHEVIEQLQRIADENDLTYTIHLAYDVESGSPDEDVRKAAVATWLKFINVTKSLPVHGFIVHLQPETYRNADNTPCLVPSKDVERWTRQTIKSMDDLKNGLPEDVDPSLMCIETLSYDLMPLVPEVLKRGFSFTLDVGHLWLNGLYDSDYVRALLPHTRIIHLHGVADLKDHMGLEKNDQNVLKEFLQILRDYEHTPIVLTLEIFSEDNLKSSLSLLRELEVL